MLFKFFYFFFCCLLLVGTPKEFLFTSENSLIMHGGYTFSSFKNQKSAAVYLTMINNSKSDLEIISLNTEVAKKTEIHEIIEEGDITKMRKIDKPTVKKGETIFFQPGGKHIMLFGLNKELNDKEKFSIFFVTSDNNNFSTEIMVINRKMRN